MITKENYESKKDDLATSGRNWLASCSFLATIIAFVGFLQYAIYQKPSAVDFSLLTEEPQKLLDLWKQAPQLYWSSLYKLFAPVLLIVISGLSRAFVQQFAAGFDRRPASTFALLFVIFSGVTLMVLGFVIQGLSATFWIAFITSIILSVGAFVQDRKMLVPFDKRDQINFWTMTNFPQKRRIRKA